MADGGVTVADGTVAKQPAAKPPTTQPLVTPKPTGAEIPLQALGQVFLRLKQGLEQKNEALFKAQWHAESYGTNLVRGSGIPGRGVFSQGSRKGWYLKAQMGAIQTVGSGPLAYVIPCAIWHTEKQRAVDRVHAAVVLSQANWVILGAGEDKGQVLALVQRYLDKKPLALPGK